MTDILTELQSLAQAKLVKNSSHYNAIGLKLNPFPAAGMPRYPNLPPLQDNDLAKIKQFIRSTYFARQEPDYAGLAIVGSYGMGKTHLLRYIQSIIDRLEQPGFAAKTCFIDRPEDSPQMAIHKVVEQIGIDNVRKYIGQFLIHELSADKDGFIKQFAQHSLFSKQVTKEIFEEPCVSNFKDFLNVFTKKLQGDINKLKDASRQIIKEKIVKDMILADRYLDLVFDSTDSGASWDVLAGYIVKRDLQHKEVIFLNSIVKILREAGFRHLYVFVDEFEDVSKLKGSKLSNYLLTLNTLINKEANWALIISLTPDALLKIKEESAPLYDRLTSIEIKLSHLTFDTAKYLLNNYLNIACSTPDHVVFDDSAIREMLATTKNNCRGFILLAHQVIEDAAEKKAKTVTVSLVNESKKVRYND